MAGIVAILSSEGNNVMIDSYEAARFSQHRGTGAYVMKIDNKPAVYEDDQLPSKSDSKIFNAIHKLEGSKVTCFITKNSVAKNRVLRSNLLVDGYLIKPKKLLNENKGKDPFMVLENKMKDLQDDLYAIGDIFSKYVKGIGVLETDNGLIVMRDQTGFRTGWVGIDSKNDKQIFAEESHIFDHNGILARELQPGEVFEMSKKGRHDGIVDSKKSKLIFDPHEIIDGFHPTTKIFREIVKEWNRDKVVEHFIPILHLEQERKIETEQEDFFKEIFIHKKEKSETET